MNESVLSMLSNRLAGGGQALCAWVTMNEPAVAEALAREAFDAVVLDMQHSKLLHVLLPLRSAEPADGHVRGTRCNLARTDEGDNIAVVAGDQPPPAVGEGDGGGEVTNRRIVFDRPEFPEDSRGVGS